MSKTCPLFLDIYFSDFACMCSNDENILYAVDTVLEYVGICLEILTEHANNRLREIFEWCSCDKMTVINTIVVFRPQLLIGTDHIKENDSFKYLGIHVDTRLKFKVRINHLKSKLSQLCGVSFRLSKFLDFLSAKKMYNSCIYSVLSYCIGYGVVSLSAHLAVMI